VLRLSAWVCICRRENRLWLVVASPIARRAGVGTAGGRAPLPSALLLRLGDAKKPGNQRGILFPGSTFNTGGDIDDARAGSADRCRNVIGRKTSREHVGNLALDVGQQAPRELCTVAARPG